METFESRQLKWVVAGDGRNVYLVLQQAGRGQRQQRQLNGRGKASRVGDALGRGNLLGLPFGQSIDKTVVLVAEILCQVDDLQPGGQGMFGHPDRTLPMCRAEKEYVDRA